MTSHGQITQGSTHINFKTNAKAEPAVDPRISVTQDNPEDGPQKILFNALGYTDWESESERKLFRQEIGLAKVKAIAPFDHSKTWSENKKLKSTEPAVHTFQSILVENRRFTVSQGCADNIVGTETPATSPRTSANRTCGVATTTPEISK
jgi:hypothetical protein